MSLSDNYRSRAAFFAFLSATVIIAHQVAGKATRDSLFLSWFSATDLPKVVMAAALLTVFAVLTMSRLLARHGPARTMPIAFGISAVLFLSEWLLLAFQPKLTSVVLYFHFALFNAVLISGFWSVINERFDPHTARPMIARVAAAAALGGVLGGIIAERVAALIDLRAMLLVLGVMHVICVFTIGQIGGGRRSRVDPQTASAASGLQILFATPYLMRMAALMILVATAAAFLDYVLKSEAAARFDSGESLITFFAGFYAVAGLLTFVVQTFFGRQVLSLLGLGKTISVLPATIAALGIVATSFTHLWTVVALRMSEAVLANSFFRSGFESLYTPLTLEKRRTTKTVIDVGSSRLGDVAGSGMLLALLWIVPDIQSSVLIGFSVVISLLSLMVIKRLHRGYVGQLEDSLRSRPLTDDEAIFPSRDGAVLVDREDLLARSETRDEPVGSEAGLLPVAQAVANTDQESEDSTAGIDSADHLLRTIREIRSGDAVRALRALGMTGATAALVPHLIPLLARRDCAAEALDALRGIAAQVTGQITDAILDPANPVSVRRQLIRVLENCATQRALDGLHDALWAESFELRFCCAQAMLRMLADNVGLAVAKNRIYIAAHAEVSVNAAEWRGRRLPGDVGVDEDMRANRSLQHVFTLLSLALDPELSQLAMRAVVSRDANLRGTALEYLHNMLPPTIRTPLWEHLEVHDFSTSERSAREVVNDLTRSAKSLTSERGALPDYPVSQAGDYLVIQLRGEIDLSLSPRLRQKILGLITADNQVLVDLCDVEFIDSSGIAVLVEALRLARTSNLGFGLTRVNHTVMQVLKLARLDQVFDIHDAPAPVADTLDA